MIPNTCGLKKPATVGAFDLLLARCHGVESTRGLGAKAGRHQFESNYQLAISRTLEFQTDSRRTSNYDPITN